MNVVIVGAKSRSYPEDKELVNSLIEAVHANYPNCLIVTTDHSEGVGKFVQDKCFQKNEKGSYKYQLAVVSLKLYVNNMPRAEVGELYKSRNATLLQLGDVYYYLASVNGTGMMEDLMKNAEALNRPVKRLLPGDQVELIGQTI